MRRNILFPLLFINVFFLVGIITSCKKDKNTITITGTVYDPNTGIYVNNAHITISASMISSGFYNSNYTDIASTTTDGSGTFSFEFDKMKSAGYRIYISKDNYFDRTINIPDADITAGTPYTPHYDIYPVAYLKLHVKNTTPYDSLDYIAYYYSEGSLNCFECCSNSIIKGYGENYDATSKCKTYGNQHIVINWHIVKGPWDGIFSDTIYCTAFDTASFEKLY